MMAFLVICILIFILGLVLMLYILINTLNDDLPSVFDNEDRYQKIMDEYLLNYDKSEVDDFEEVELKFNKDKK